MKAAALPASAPEAAAQTEGTALAVIALTKGGPAEKAGVSIGDIILSAGDVPVFRAKWICRFGRDYR